MRDRLLALALAAAVGTIARPARAFCRTTTCDACPRDADGCTIGGIPIAWRQRCVSYSLQPDVAPGLTYEGVAAVLDLAFGAWQEVTCTPADGAPAISASNAFGVALCQRHEYNQHQANANIIVFRDASWTYTNATNALALTTVTYSTRTGDILDVDMEINGTMSFSLEPGGNGPDLQSVVTHEAGHFLGLDHSQRPGATMRPYYNPDMQHLGADDIAGICTIYPPDTSKAPCDFTPRQGFSAECALDPTEGGRCSTAPGRTAARSGSAASIGAAAWLLLWRRSRRRRGKAT